MQIPIKIHEKPNGNKTKQKNEQTKQNKTIKQYDLFGDFVTERPTSLSLLIT